MRGGRQARPEPSAAAPFKVLPRWGRENPPPQAERTSAHLGVGFVRGVRGACPGFLLRPANLGGALCIVAYRCPGCPGCPG